VSKYVRFIIDTWDRHSFAVFKNTVFLGRKLFTNVYFLELFYEMYFVKLNAKLRAIFLKIQLDRKDL